jgi:hypothetical protein
MRSGGGLLVASVHSTHTIDVHGCREEWLADNKNVSSMAGVVQASLGTGSQHALVRGAARLEKRAGRVGRTRKPDSEAIEMIGEVKDDPRQNRAAPGNGVLFSPSQSSIFVFE